MTQMKYDDLFNINDTYKIKKDLEDIKKLILEIEEDVNKFLGPKKPKIRGVRARAKITKLKNKLLPEMARKILKTKQDYQSDYS
ncbi:hypothetical protein KBD45_03530 [Candidatus Dojkabacteria bacterium]|nr:hypothetical protein [Candidatus Dojkabacteria bacterium]